MSESYSCVAFASLAVRDGGPIGVRCIVPKMLLSAAALNKTPDKRSYSKTCFERKKEGRGEERGEVNFRVFRL